jgi:hypothetical protein
MVFEKSLDHLQARLIMIRGAFLCIFQLKKEKEKHFGTSRQQGERQFQKWNDQE